MRRYVIIGAGVAGIAAAESINRTDPTGEVIVVCEEAEGYYSRPGLAYFLSHEIPEAQLFPMQKGDYQRQGIHLIHAQAELILPEARQLRLVDGRHLEYDRLLIATGSQASPLRMPGSDAEGVVKLDCIADAKCIHKLARKGHSAVVVGGGITALEIVEGLRAHGVQVHYLLRGDRYWGNVLDETESKIVEHRLAEERVNLHYHSELAEIITKKGRVSQVRTKDGQQIACDLLAFAIGVQPRMELALRSGIRAEKGIAVDEFLRTSAENVFAAGDVAQTYDPKSGKSVLDTLWGLARNQGELAGINMASQNGLDPYVRKTAFNVTRLAGLTTTIIGAVGQGRDEDLMGIARGDSEIWRQTPDATAIHAQFDVNRVRVLLGEDNMVGALIMGDQSLSRPLLHMVEAQVDIRPIADQLTQPNAPVAQIIQDFWSKVKEAYAA